MPAVVEYIKAVYQYDPVQGVYHKHKRQPDPAEVKDLPGTMRIEKNQRLPINCSLILTYLHGLKWPVMTGLSPVFDGTGHYTGNIVTTGPQGKRKTSMVVVQITAMAGTMVLYLFPDMDYASLSGRCKAAKEFITFLNNKRAPVETAALK